MKRRQGGWTPRAVRRSLEPIEILVGEVTAELISSLRGLDGLVTETITYADSASGVVVSFDFLSAAGLGSRPNPTSPRSDSGKGPGTAPFAPVGQDRSA